MLIDPAPPVEPPRRSRRKLILGIVAVVVGAVLLLCAGLVALAIHSGDTSSSPRGVANIPATTAASPPAPTTYAPLTDREWALLAKDPDQYTGRGFVVYGIVVQADAATGRTQLLALAGGTQADDPAAYQTSTLFTGDAKTLAELIEGDQFTADVTDQGSFSYDTQTGGNTTVPRLHVDTISITTPAPGDRPVK